MNINFIGKEFERLAQLEDYINYEYEPKSNMKYGKRNIYFDDIKLDFINEVNTYGFSPFILESFVEQREDPNIMRFITKRFNHGLTNYVKLQTKGVFSHYKKNKKKLLFQKSMKNLKNRSTEKIKKKKQNLISNIFLIRKNEEEDVKINDRKNNFLKKALGGMGGNKLNIDMNDININMNMSDKKQILHEEKNNDTSSERKQDKNKNNINANKIPLLKKILAIYDKENIQKNNIQNELPSILNNNYNYDEINIKQGNLKSFLDKINKVSLDNKYYINDDRKVLTLSKNKNILGNKRIFSPIISRNSYKTNEQIQTFRKKSKLIRNKSMEPQNMKENNKFGMKIKNQKNNNTDEFLLFAKAIPYKYIVYGNNFPKKDLFEYRTIKKLNSL